MTNLKKSVKTALQSVEAAQNHLQQLAHSNAQASAAMAELRDAVNHLQRALSQTNN